MNIESPLFRPLTLVIPKGGEAERNVRKDGTIEVIIEVPTRNYNLPELAAPIADELIKQAELTIKERDMLLEELCVTLDTFLVHRALLGMIR